MMQTHLLLVVQLGLAVELLEPLLLVELDLMLLQTLVVAVVVKEIIIVMHLHMRVVMAAQG